MKPGSPTRTRLILVMSTIAYVTVFNLVYEYYVSPPFSYFGCSYTPPSLGYQAVSWAVSIIPALWLPTRFDRPSLFLFYVQYFTVFIPAVFIVYHSSIPELSPDEALELVLLMFTGLTIIQAFYRRPLIEVRARRWSPALFWSVFCALAIVLAGSLLVVLGSHFRIVSLDEIYDLRSTIADVLESSAGGRLASYAAAWMAGLVLPLLFAVAAFARRPRLIAVVVIGYVVLFGLTGTKTTLFFVPYAVAVYFLVNRFGHSFGAGYCLAMTTLLALTPVLVVVAPAETSLLYLGIVPFRFFAVPALTIPEYFRFFQDHPQTYLSHVTGFSLFVDYPYDATVPHVIGTFFYGNPNLSNNSGFWAADGLASFGPAGIIIMSVVCGFVFWLFDSLAREHDPRFIALAMAFMGFSFSSTSLFTTLVTGGWLMLMFALAVMPRSGVLASAFRPAEPAALEQSSMADAI